ncbi:MAG: caspase family protein [Muribaculaceae bacterium]|nr:caspase family protein [Muribaculaceae bacterium]
MKHYISVLAILLCAVFSGFAQGVQSRIGGNCGTDCKWSYDGYTLTISNVNKKGLDVSIDDYNTSSILAPWTKRKLDIKKVVIGSGVTKIGSCAFANMPNLQEVVFEDPNLYSIGWGAFMNDKHLRTISLPVNLKNIETIAFANCDALASVKIPDQCRVGDQAYVSCDNLKSIELSPTAILGHYVFADETEVDGKPRHTLYNGEVRRLPAYINKENCNEYGIAPEAVEKLTSNRGEEIDYDYETSDVDKFIPVGPYMRNNTYALIIGNQNYRFVSDVPYAIHDARVFADYCRKTLGIPTENIHVSEDATKQMIMEEELQDWIASIPNPEDKNLIVYYAGHGVPDVKNKNKAYLLPTDVRGTSPQRGIALDDFYQQLGDLDFNHTTVLLDACFSGVNRENEGVTEGLRGVEIDAENAELGGGKVVVFSAAQGNETAQGYPEEGHGLFTYYLLKELQETNGMTTLGSLSDNVTTNVSRKAPQMKMRKSQTPSANASDQLSENWRKLRF